LAYCRSRAASGVGPAFEVDSEAFMARILIAEDDDSMRQFLARALTRAGHDVVSVGNGADALAVCVRGRFDLLLADIVMPEIDGLELARRAVLIDRDLRVMFITGFAAVALQRRRPKDPPAKVLSKPFHLRALVAEVERALSEPTADRPARG
jgi:two-component system cell cycle response regulator CpdR